MSEGRQLLLSASAEKAIAALTEALRCEAMHDLLLFRGFTFQGLNDKQLTACIDHYEATTGNAASELPSA